MKKLLSYIYPVTKKTASSHNGMLEISWINGKKILDSENANYSYGSLQRVLEKGIKLTSLTNVNTVLLLGLGGGSVIKSLREKFNYKKHIHAIEIDNDVITIAKNEFNIDNSELLTIENTDAFTFIEKNTTQYDLVIVDLFIDTEVPPKFYSKTFYKNLSKALNNNAFLLFNLGIDIDKNIQIDEVFSFFNDSLKFRDTQIVKINKTNSLLVANKK